MYDLEQVFGLFVLQFPHQEMEKILIVSMHINYFEKFLVLGKLSILLSIVIIVTWNPKIPEKNFRELED